MLHHIIMWIHDVTQDDVVILHIIMCTQDVTYGVATISRLLKIIGLFCKRAL